MITAAQHAELDRIFTHPQLSPHAAHHAALLEAGKQFTRAIYEHTSPGASQDDILRGIVVLVVKAADRIPQD